MASQHELQVQQKREVEKKRESTIPTRAFLPITDIFETEQALTVILEMPGVDKDNVDVRVENDVLSIEGRVDFSKYEGLRRSTSNTMSATTHAASRSRARSSNGDHRRAQGRRHELGLAKAEKAKPRKIKVS